MQKKRKKTAGGKKAANNKKAVASRRGAAESADGAVKDNSKRNYELRGLVFVAAGLIFLCGIAGLNVGFIGLKAAKFLQYFFGIGSFFAAGAFLGAGGYYIMKHQKLVFNARVLGGAGFFACALAMYHHLAVKAGEEILPESLVNGGGLLGGAICMLLHGVAGVDGTPILLAVGLIGTLIVTTTWSLAQGILTTKEKAEKGADVAKKATVVVYDKTIEVGGKAREQVQEYVQEHIDDVGEKLKRLRGKQFLARYEQDSAFLNDAASDTGYSGGTAGAVTNTAEKAVKADALKSKMSGAGIAAELMAEKLFTPPPANAAELVNANPVAAGFFAEKFSSAAEPEEVPELAVQLGLEPENAASASAEKVALADSAGEVTDFDWEAFSREAGQEPWPVAEAIGDIKEEDIAESIAEAINLPPGDGVEDIEPVEGNVGEFAGQAVYDAGEDVEQWTYDAGENSEQEYDYGIDDMEITYPEDSVELTEGNSSFADYDGDYKDDEVEAEVVGTVEASVPPPPPYNLPPLHLLSKTVKTMNESLNQEISSNARILGETLANFKVKASILNACHGPAVTRYEVKPAPGVKVSKITGLADDIALNMAATAVRIEQIPGKAAIGIEVPNRELESVQLREVLENPAFAAAKSKLTVGLGKDIGGQAIFADLAKMPHLLVAGATGSGKSVCINTLITSILFKAKPDEVKFILIDPKMVELSVYNDIPHLMVPVVTDAKKAASVLNWAVQEMEKRYGLIAQEGVRNMEGYNRIFAEEPEKQLPSIEDIQKRIK